MTNKEHLRLPVTANHRYRSGRLPHRGDLRCARRSLEADPTLRLLGGRTTFLRTAPSDPTDRFSHSCPPIEGNGTRRPDQALRGPRSPADLHLRTHSDGGSPGRSPCPIARLGCTLYSSPPPNCRAARRTAEGQPMISDTLLNRREIGVGEIGVGVQKAIISPPGRGNRGRCAKSNYLTSAPLRSSHAANSLRKGSADGRGQRKGSAENGTNLSAAFKVNYPSMPSQSVLKLVPFGSADEFCVEGVIEGVSPSKGSRRGQSVHSKGSVRALVRKLS